MAVATERSRRQSVDRGKAGSKASAFGQQPIVQIAFMSAASNTAALDRADVERIVREIVLSRNGAARALTPETPKLVVSISARHCHLTDEHVETLFGAGHKLTPMKDLYQDGFYAAEETVMVVGPRRRMLPAVRVLGPTRPYTQVELAFTDAISLGLELAGPHERQCEGNARLRARRPGGRRRIERRRDPRRAARSHEFRPRGVLRRQKRRPHEPANRFALSDRVRTTWSSEPTPRANWKSTSTPTKATPSIWITRRK